MSAWTRILRGIDIKKRLESLTGNDRLDASAIKNLSSGGGSQTAPEIRDLLTTLVGVDRLSATAIKDLPSNPTATEIRDLLATLTGTNRLDASAIKNLAATLTATDIRDLLTTLVGTNRLSATAIKDLPAGSTPPTAIEIRDLLTTLAGNDRLDASAIKNLPPGSTPPTATEIRDLLTTLTGTNRLDASAIKNLPAGGGLTDGDYGDVTISGSGTNIAIDGRAVTVAKIQAIASGAILGRSSAGSGDIEQLTLGSGLSLSGGVLTATGGGGGGGLSAWQTISSSFTANYGDRLRVDDSAGNVIITMPAPSPVGADIAVLPITPNSPNSIRLATASDKYDGQNTDVRIVKRSGVAEIISYTGSSLGWLGQSGHLDLATKTLTHISDGDTNGLFYWVGTNQNKQGFVNPCINPAKIVVIASSENSITQAKELATDRSTIDDGWASSNTANSWIGWDLLSGKNILISKYSIRSRNAANNTHPRNWVLEGTNSIAANTIADWNSATWTTIDTQTNNTTFNAIAQWLTITVSPSIAYRYIRIRSTGLNSSGSSFFVIGDIEFYGVFSS